MGAGGDAEMGTAEPSLSLQMLLKPRTRGPGQDLSCIFPSARQLDVRLALCQVRAGSEQPEPARERSQSIFMRLDPYIAAGDRNLFNFHTQDLVGATED